MGSIVFEMDANFKPFENKHEEIIKLLEKSNAHMIQKLEKLTLVMKDTVEKTNFYMRIMINRMSGYFKELFDNLDSYMKMFVNNFNSDISQTCSNFGNFEIKIATIKKQLEILNKSLQKDTWSESIWNASISLASLGASLVAFSGPVGAIGASLLAIGLMLPQIDLATKLKNWIIGFNDLKKNTEDFYTTYEDMLLLNKKLDASVSDLEKGIGGLEKKFDVFDNKLKSNKESLDLYKQVMADTSDPFAKSASAISNVKDSLTGLTNEIDVLQEKCEKTFPLDLSVEASGLLGVRGTASAGMSAVLSPLKEEWIGIRGYIEKAEEDFQQKSLTSWKAWSDAILGLFGGIWSSIKGTYEQFKTGFEDISKSWSTGAEKGGFFGGLQASLPGIGSMVGLLTKVPEIIKQVWASIKDFAKKIASLFGWMSEEEKVQKDVLRDLGATISDDLAKKIADASKDMGDRFSAVTLHLGDIMRETDITAKNFDTFASRARDVFSLLETGMIDATMATSTLNDVFPQLAEEADKLGITFNKNMIEMIQLSRQFGLEVESIKQYVEEKLGIAVQGLTTATQNLGEIGQAEFDRLARAAAATFLIASMIYVIKKKFVYRFLKGLLSNDRV